MSTLGTGPASATTSARSQRGSPPMATSGRRPATRAAITILSAVLLTGCTSQPNARDAAGQPAAASTRSAPTRPPATSPPPARAAAAPITGAERDWFTAVRKLDKTMNAVLTDETNIYVSPEKLRSMADQLATCGRELAHIGAPPTSRFQPAYTLAQQACQRYSKGARCFRTAADIGTPVAGTAAERKFTESINCGFAAPSDGSLLLAKAVGKIIEVRVAADDM
jgi:hypothetical protein